MRSPKCRLQASCLTLRLHKVNLDLHLVTEGLYLTTLLYMYVISCLIKVDLGYVMP